MPPLATDLFDYDLPPRLIAQTPADRRDASRLLVVHRAEHRIEHRHFSDLGDYLHPGDTLFRNNAAVLPARLLAHRPTGGAVECLLLRPAADGETWWCLIRPGKKLPPGASFGIEGSFTATVLEKDSEGAARIVFACAPGPDGAPSSIIAVANRLGEVPLPPYIERQHTADERRADLERYQTVYADRARQVAAAAPTAGLHFTPELLATLAARGVLTADLTLHVGLGTFKPISTDTIEAHAIHREIYEIPPGTQAALLARAPGTRRIAVGTTSVRSLEDFWQKHHSHCASTPEPGASRLFDMGGMATPRTATPRSTSVLPADSVAFHPASTPASDRTHLSEAAIYLYPPRQFPAIDALITNFHQPRSTLLCLVSAFISPGSTDGIAWLREIYAEAIARDYRFFSYGDAMLIL
jgi:S-adenosylmethionine:tRNA ribosyltransferase-isomerase